MGEYGWKKASWDGAALLLLLCHSPRDNIGKMKNIFIADDDLDLLNLYAKTFRLLGYEAETAVNGREALDKLAASGAKPDIILLDLMMPELSGFEVLENLKKDDALKDIPVIVMTNLASLPDESKDLGKIRSLGAADIVIKSNVDPQELVKIADVLLEQK